MRNVKNKKFNQIHFLSITMGLSMLYFASVGIKHTFDSKYTTAVVIVNNDNALIINNDECYENINDRNILVLQFDDEKCHSYKVNEIDYLSINDLAVSLVGEDGNVTYYEFEREKNKTLSNVK